MKRIRNWIVTRFDRSSPTIEVDECRLPVAVKTAENVKEEYLIEQTCGAEYENRLESDMGVKDVSMPDIYSSDDTVAHKQLNVLNKMPSIDGESAGFDPYDTGRLEISKIQGSRSKK